MPSLCLVANAASSHTQKWAVQLAERGWKLDIISTLPAKIPGIQVHMIPGIFGSTVDGILNYRWVKKTVDSLQPDIVHAHYASSFGLMGALLGRHPLIISAWGSDIFEFPLKSALHRKILTWTLNQADVLCSTSKVMAQEMYKYIPGQQTVHIIPFGVDVERFSPRAAGAGNTGVITFGVAKYLEKVYGLDILLRSFARLARNYPKGIRLRIAGDGSQEENLKRLASDLGITHLVEWFGRLPNEAVAEFYSSIDVAVVPSRQESFGVTAVEAAACGLPVIASNVGGLPEVVIHDKTGLLFSAESINELTDSMEYFVQNFNERINFGRSGRQFVLANYDWQKNVTAMENLYKEVL